MNDQKQIDLFGKKCAAIIGVNERGWPIIKSECNMTTYAANIETYPKLEKVLEKYSESSDGFFNFLLEVEWSSSPYEEKEIYLLKMSSEYMDELIQMMELEMKQGQWTYRIIVASDLQDNDIIYDQTEFMNLLSHNYFGFELIRPGRKIHQRNGAYLSEDSVLI